MRVILLQDVAKIGRRFQVVEVPDGYAMNKLVPQSLAQPATPENMKRIEARNSKVAADSAVENAQFADIVAALEDKEIKYTQSANQSGGLFEVVKNEAIAEALSKQTGLAVPASYVVVAEPIKHTGEHQIELAHGTEKAQFNFVVEAA